MPHSWDTLRVHIFGDLMFGGARTEGLVIKDYRVRAPSNLGRAYSDANECPSDAERDVPRSKDPDSVGRGLAARSRTQNYLAGVIRELSWIPRSPKPSVRPG